jgi:hypothetical protein
MNAPFDRKAYLAAVLKPAKAKRAKPTQSEAKLQEQIVSAIRKAYPRIYVQASAAGGSRHALEAMRLKRTGVSPGFPDLYLMFEDGSHGFIEVKTPEKNITESSLSEYQKEFKRLCDFRGVPWAVVNDVKTALDYIEVWRP